MKRTILILGVLVVVLFAGFALIVTFGQRTNGPTRDARMISDVNQVQLALELYKRDHGIYPSIGKGCSSLLSVGDLAPKYLPRIPTSTQTVSECAYPFCENGVEAMMIGTNASGTSYVLAAPIVRTAHEALDSDLDGVILGCGCDDPVYCAGV